MCEVRALNVVRDGSGAIESVAAPFRNVAAQELSGVDNLFDRAPPVDPFFEGWPFVNRALHDNRGRFGFLEYRHSW